MSLCVIISFPPSLSSFLFPNAPTSPPPNPVHTFRFMNTHSDQQSMKLLYNRSHLGTHTKIFLYFLKVLFLWLFPSLVSLAWKFSCHLFYTFNNTYFFFKDWKALFFFALIIIGMHIICLEWVYLSYLELTKSIWFSIWGLYL